MICHDACGGASDVPSLKEFGSWQDHLFQAHAVDACEYRHIIYRNHLLWIIMTCFFHKKNSVTSVAYL